MSGFSGFCGLGGFSMFGVLFTFIMFTLSAGMVGASVSRLDRTGIGYGRVLFWGLLTGLNFTIFRFMLNVVYG